LDRVSSVSRVRFRVSLMVGMRVSVRDMVSYTLESRYKQPLMDYVFLFPKAALYIYSGLSGRWHVERLAENANLYRCRGGDADVQDGGRAAASDRKSWSLMTSSQQRRGSFLYRATSALPVPHAGCESPSSVASLSRNSSFTAPTTGAAAAADSSQSLQLSPQ